MFSPATIVRSPAIGLPPAALYGYPGAPRRRADVYPPRWNCRVLSKHNTTHQDYRVGFINGMPTIEWPRKPIESVDVDHRFVEIQEEGILEMVHEVKSMLGSMGDGDINISAYDTAWVALVPDLHGNGGPQFPTSLQWIADNQLSDGSWGDNSLFTAHDRVINTLACVIALKSWNTHHEKWTRGLAFLRENMWKLAEEDAMLMPIGFEVAFPSLMEIAKGLELEVPYDDPALQDIYTKRNLKLKRIPREVMHQVPTTLLHSLEGMPDLDWERLLGLQCRDGSFLFSPSSTAYALMQTGDGNCLLYLQKTVERFNGGVPNVYPLDLFEHLWAIDRLERLGISRYFEAEIKECMDYVYRYWTEDGICWARNSPVQDVDDTAMGFRLLRLHGYHVSPDVFANFRKDDEFFCFAGQSNQAVTGVYNLNRASQLRFPGEEIMDAAMRFSHRFLREKQASKQLQDKWIITKDLPGEVEYALDFPWYANLPRVETRLYVEQYGGSSDAWIGKTLYRMQCVNNDLYLNLAKSDFNRCQALHQDEWLRLQKWYEKSGLQGYGVTRERTLRAYFLATACVFEPDRAAERLGWARTIVVAEAVSMYLENADCIEEARRQLITDFQRAPFRFGWNLRGEGAVAAMLWQLIDLLATFNDDHRRQPLQQQQQQQFIRNKLSHAWEEWLLTWQSEKDGDGRRWLAPDDTGLLLVRTIEACGGRLDQAANPVQDRLNRLTSSVCRRLSRRMIPSHKVNTESSGIHSEDAINSEMQELVQCVLQGSDGGLSNLTKQTFLHVVKSYYYAAHCAPETIERHIAMLLFVPVA